MFVKNTYVHLLKHLFKVFQTKVNIHTVHTDSRNKNIYASIYRGNK